MITPLSTTPVKKLTNVKTLWIENNPRVQHLQEFAKTCSITLPDEKDHHWLILKCWAAEDTLLTFTSFGDKYSEGLVSQIENFIGPQDGPLVIKADKPFTIHATLVPMSKARFE